MDNIINKQYEDNMQHRWSDSRLSLIHSSNFRVIRSKFDSLSARVCGVGVVVEISIKQNNYFYNVNTNTNR